MTTDFVIVKGYIKDGQLRVDLPENVADGEVTVQIPIQTDMPWDERPWTEAELADLLRPEKPLTGAEIVAAGLTGGWEDLGIEDSVAWLSERKRERRKQSRW